MTLQQATLTLTLIRTTRRDLREQALLDPNLIATLTLALTFIASCRALLCDWDLSRTSPQNRHREGRTRGYIDA